MIDVAHDEKTLRKGRPGILESKRYVIDDIDLPSCEGAYLNGLQLNVRHMRATVKGPKPLVMAHLNTESGLAEVVASIETEGMLLPD